MLDLAIYERLIAHECVNSFYAFRQFVNPQLIIGDFPRSLCHKLQKFYDDYEAGLAPRLLINAPPQHGKTTAIVDFIAWMIGKHPELRAIYASFSDRLGKRASRALLRILSSSQYRLVFPHIELTGQQTLNFIEFNKNSYFRATTINGAITGESMELGIIDDAVKGRAEANSFVIRERIWDWFTDDFLSRFAKNHALLIIMTRWHVDDIAGRMGDGIEKVCYKAIDENGNALFPELKDIGFLMRVKKSMPPSSWESLYQQSPVTKDGNVFKPRNIQIVDAIPAVKKWCRGWDLAASANKGDCTASAKLGLLPDGRIIIADVVSGQYGPDEVERIIVNCASADGHDVKIRLPQDPGQAGKAQSVRIARLLHGYAVKFVPPRGSKENRADGFAAQVNIGNVLMIRAPWNNKLIDKMATFTGASGGQDDEVDALSDAYDEITSGGIGFENII